MTPDASLLGVESLQEQQLHSDQVRPLQHDLFKLFPQIFILLCCIDLVDTL